MKLGIIGLPQAGKTTIFEALCGARGEEPQQQGGRSDNRIATVRVADERVDFLSDLYKPKKTTYAQMEYMLPSTLGASSPEKVEGAFWNQVRSCDALIHVVRNFQGTLGVAPSPVEDFFSIEEEMILSDLAVVENKVERLELDSKRGKKPDAETRELIDACRALLEDSRPIRNDPQLASAPALRGFTFLSAKPQLIIINNDDEDEALPDWPDPPEKLELLVVRGGLEREITSLPPDETMEFMEAYHIEKTALDRVIRSSYELLNLISFFTVGEDEVKAWTIRRDTPALEAAGSIHSDIQKGFIRAEVLAYDDLIKAGNFQEAKKAGLVRLEGKDYIVCDGDIAHFRFNV